MGMLRSANGLRNGALGAVRQLGFEGSSGFANLAPEAVTVVRCRRHGGGHACDCRYVVGAAATSQLLAATMQQRLEGDAGSDVEQPHPLGTTEFVSGEGEQVYAGSAQSQVNVGESLNGIGMKEG